MNWNARGRSRVRDDVWDEWGGGIDWNLKLPAFAESWKKISKRGKGGFNEFRRFIDGNVGKDPKKWDRGN